MRGRPAKVRTRVARLPRGRAGAAGTKDGAAALEPVGATTGPWLLQLRTLQVALLNGDGQNRNRLPTRTLTALEPVGTTTGPRPLQVQTFHFLLPIDGNGENGTKVPTRTGTQLNVGCKAGTTRRPWLLQLRKVQVAQPMHGFGKIGNPMAT